MLTSEITEGVSITFGMGGRFHSISFGVRVLAGAKGFSLFHRIQTVTRGTQTVVGLCYKPKDRGFKSL
jgi:hypothetical protein